jgi:hypothetical protein
VGALCCAVVVACGARTPLELPSASEVTDASVDGGPDVVVPPPEAGADAPQPTACAPGVIVGAALNPAFIALDATDVYFVDMGDPAIPSDGFLGRCSKTKGCAMVAEQLVSGRHSPAGLALDDAHVYWTEVASSSAYSCAKVGCSPVTLFNDGADSPITVLADGTLLDLISYHAIETCPVTGCAAPQKLTQLTYGGLVVTADAQWIYFTTATPQGAPRGSVMACAKPACAGGPKTIAASLPATPWGLAIDDTDVYISTGGGAADPDGSGAILRCPKTGCGATPTTLVAGRNHPVYLAADSRRVYWIEQGSTARGFTDGAVAACAKSGCGGIPRRIADLQYLPSAIAVEPGCVYWSTSSQGPAHGLIQRAPTAGL